MSCFSSNPCFSFDTVQKYNMIIGHFRVYLKNELFTVKYDVFGVGGVQKFKSSFPMGSQKPSRLPPPRLP